MDASNRLNVGFDSGRGISLDYAGSGMDRGLPDFSIQLPVVSTRSDISLPSCVSTNVFSQPLSASREGDGYHFRPRPPPTTRVEFLESDRKRDSRDQRSTAMQWSNISKEIDSLLKEIQSEIHVTLSPEEAKKSVDLLLEKWDRLEGLHGRYLAGINERKRLEHVQERYSTLKREVDDIINECEGLFRRPDPRHDELGMDRGLPVWDPKQDDNKSVHSVATHVTKHSEASSVSSQKKSLKRALVSKMKLDLARARAKEDAEAARVAHEYKQRMELRRLEEEATLAELEWKIEMDNLTESKLPPVVPSALNTSTFIVNKQSHSTPVTSEYVSRDGFNSQPSAVYVISSGTPQSTEPKYPAVSRPSDTMLSHNESSVKGLNTTTPSAGINSTQSPERVNFGRSQTVSSMDQAPRDHVAAMWKAQYLSGIKPTQFSGNPAEFPFFREQVRTHLESDLLTDAQQVEYLPKFVAGEALEVVKRNRGCTFNEIMKTLEERFGQAVRVTQACVEELASGPKLAYGDNTGLLNFSENLNAATRILKGDVEREASVATNLRRIVNRLPNDLILKWQTVNYELVKSGRSARLKDVADFVHKQASIRNDPVFGLQTFKRENKNTKLPPKLPVKNTTISTTGVDHKTPASENTEHCGICKSSKRHKLQECPIIKQCKHVAVRRQYAASCGFCFNCGLERPGHGSGSCPDPPACSVCSGRHIPLLHSESNYGGRRFIPRNNRESSDKSDKPLATPKSPNSERGNVTPAASGDKSDKSVGKVPISSAAVATVQAKVLLNVIPVVISAENGKTVSTYAFLDSGCTDTLIEQDLVDHLGIQGTPVQIGINTISSSDNVVESKRVSFTLTSVDTSGESIDVSEAYVLPNLNQSRCTLPEQIDTIEYPHLRDVEFPEVDIKRVSILVGNNIPYAHLQKEVRVPEDKKKGLYGCRYPLGWCVCGPYGANCRQGVSANFVSIDPEPRSLIEKFWNLEDYGTLKSNEKPLSVEDKIALKIIENTTRCVDGRYEVGMLWKEKERQFPNNVAMAKHRLECLRRRLTKPGNEEMAVKYREVMDSYISSGFARKLSEEELNKESKTHWYLPHHPVTSPTKPGKVRIVFDAAAECEGTSLNKNLLTGPDVANNLVGVLLRFRQGKIAFAADIEKMFHQIRVREEDQDSLRFLWWTNGYDNPPDTYVMQVHIFGAASSPCIANSTLRRVADDNAEEYSSSVITAVKRNFYVDDALPSENDEQCAIRLAHDMVELLARGGFNLTKFTSNSKRLLSAVPNDKRSKPDLNLDLDELPIERALGVRWSVGDDTLGFEIRSLVRPETKRGILSTVCSLFDPLGFAAPVALSARRLIQDLWKANIGWDEPLSEEFLSKWRAWNTELPLLSELSIPRSYFLSDGDPRQCKLQLHVFSDASEIGYGASSYLRSEYPDGRVHCAFIIGKARNAPVKFVSIPRLELQAAVLATRMFKMLREELELNISRTYLWTDSEIVLHYLRNEKRRLQTFVANRVEEIREHTLVEDWHHVPGSLNPADYVSRGMSPSSLTADHMWLRGPDFLWEPETCWPTDKCQFVPDEGLELKKEALVHSVQLSPNPSVTKKEDTRPTAVESCEEPPLRVLLTTCSDWSRLRRRMAWLLRFVQFVKDKQNAKTGRLSVDDFDAATAAIVRIVQGLAYAQEIKDLKSNGAVKPSSKVASLNPKLDEGGILRVNGRGQLKPTSCTLGQQMIFPRDHPVAKLVVRHVHHLIGHLGREHVIAKLREDFWIPQVRVLVRSVLNRCLTCKKLNAKPMTQQMAPLPKCRLTAYEPPFSFTGMDLFGPIYVKHGRGTAKRWCCLFTCLTTRSVHLEVVNSMDTDEFIMCLRRFINRRGDVKELRCDNGSNFVGSERELKKSLQEWNQGQIERELIQRGCKWIFQPPTASSMSGVWERMVRSAKTVLKSILGAQTVTDVVLRTLVTEVERILNGRALTANSDDPNDLEPLTPAHLLMQRKIICLPPGVFEKTDIYRKKWRQVQFLANLFWERWLKEYIPTLQQRGKWRRVLPNIKPDALVLLVNDNTPRGHWNLGRVLETYPGADGLVRTVKVKTKDAVYVRPIQKLCLLENDVKEVDAV